MGNPQTRISAELNTSWNTGVIAKPTFFNLRLQSFRPANAIGINYGQAPQFDASTNEDEHLRVWDFQIYILANSDSDREKMIEETLRIVRDYGYASGWTC